MVFAYYQAGLGTDSLACLQVTGRALVTGNCAECISAIHVPRAKWSAKGGIHALQGTANLLLVPRDIRNDEAGARFTGFLTAVVSGP